MTLKDVVVDPVRELVELLETRKCLAWIGSGLSVPAGYANWDKTIRALALSCFGEEKRLESYIVQGRHLDAAEKCKEKCEVEETDQYYRTLAELFGCRVVTRRLAYEFLIKLPFAGYITTNYDPLLQYEASREDCQLVSYPGLLGERNLSKPVYYIHGSARQSGKTAAKCLVLSKSEFYKAYENPGLVRGFLMNRIVDHHVLFIACELDEPELQESMRRLSRIIAALKEASHMEVSPRYCALRPVGTEQAMKAEKDRFRDLGITEIFRYRKGDDRFSGLEDFLESLCLESGYELPTPLPVVRSGVEERR